MPEQSDKQESARLTTHDVELLSRKVQVLTAVRALYSQLGHVTRNEAELNKIQQSLLEDIQKDLKDPQYKRGSSIG